ncbi:water channel [Trichosporon asahii var. asahii CBS 8904]|uniref:Water channel n=1 Tax=Trichosporon asahii var. asahii (strain CBS 8904) TaxID=1220162 RepID=K1WQY3_TRIAC|nr:water channel [Trichosporon asahii var. asahii CBS 8904]
MLTGSFFIAVMFGASLGTNVWCFFRISGGLFNPAVTTAFVIVGAITPVRGVLLFITQLLGGLAGAALADVLTPGPLLAETTLGGGASVSRGFFIEFFMTFMLVTSILLLAGFKNRATFIAPLGIGLSFFICEMFSVNYTGGSLNPARSLGPAATNHNFPSYHWIYWIAPLCGAALAAVFFLILKYLKYETNLGPDCDDDGFTYGYQLDMRDRMERVENHLANLSTHYVPAGRQTEGSKVIA